MNIKFIDLLWSSASVAVDQSHILGPPNGSHQTKSFDWTIIAFSKNLLEGRAHKIVEVKQVKYHKVLYWQRPTDTIEKDNKKLTPFSTLLVGIKMVVKAFNINYGCMANFFFF